ncbi:DUF5671 domain-containing protein, partial [Chloroflexota bacterium]
MSNVRRVYLYLVSLITLGIFAAGVRALLYLLFDIAVNGSPSAGSPEFLQQQLSLGIAMLVIGGPLWFFFWRSAQRHTGTNQTEIGSVIRKAILNLILVVTTIMSLLAAKDFLNWLISGVPLSQNPAASISTLIVTIAILLYYCHISEKEGHPSSGAMTLRRWYIYIVSGWGLVWLTVGTVQFIDACSLLLPVWGQVMVTGKFWIDPVQNNVAWLVLGGLYWYLHWFRFSANDVRSTLRQVYIYLLATIASSIAGLVALVLGLYRIFVWAFGTIPNAGDGYFQFLGWVIPTIIVSAFVWIYHRIVAQEESAGLPNRLLSARRLYIYIMSFIGLGAVISGLIPLLGIFLDVLSQSISPPLAIQPDWWQRQLALCLSLLIVAVPLWWYYWNRIILLAEASGLIEWRARLRRIYLYLVIGAAIIGLAAALVNIIYQLLNGILSGNLGINVLRSTRWSIQSLITAAPVLAFHWHIARSEQKLGAEAIAEQKLVSVLAESESSIIISNLEDRLGYKVRFLQNSGIETIKSSFSEDEITALVNKIESSSTKNVMLLLRDGEII